MTSLTMIPNGTIFLGGCSFKSSFALTLIGWRFHVSTLIFLSPYLVTVLGMDPAEAVEAGEKGFALTHVEPHPLLFQLGRDG